MLSLIFRGKVVDRKAVNDPQAKVCAVVVLQITGFALGSQQVTTVMCWLPAGLSRRKEFLLKDDNKWFTVRADWIYRADPSRRAELKPEYEVVIAEIDY